MELTQDRAEERIEALEKRLETLENNQPEDKLSMVVFSGDLDKLLASFIIATGAAAMYDRVVMFFTFWGTSVLRDRTRQVKKQDLMAKMFDKMMPRGASGLNLSKMHMAGMGTGMMKSLMKKKNVMSLEDLMKTAADSGVEIVICEMSMDLMGFKSEEMIDYPNITLGGAAKYLAEAGSSKVSLFI
jgi:peroxiredoxin family protein